jgi:hypothetical protein
MSKRNLLWLGRVVGVAIFALVHFGILFTLQLRVFGTGGESLAVAQTYRESAQGQRDELIVDVLEWPVLKPVEMALGPDVRNDLLIWDLLGWAPGYNLHSLSVEPDFVFVVVNSLTWGIGVWLVLELLLRQLRR